MKSCPDCLFLIEDDQERCSTCAPSATTDEGLHGFGGSGGGTALLTAPSTHTDSRALTEQISQPHLETRTVTFRPARRRVSPTMILMFAVVAVVGLFGVSYAGHGPLADTFAGWNLTMNPPESFPQNWEPLEDVGGAFEVDLPLGSSDIFEVLDENNPAGGGVVGKQVSTDQGATLTMVWTNFSMDPASLRSFDSAEGINELASKYAALRINGEPTVQRNVTLPVGYAVDAVFVDSSAKPHPVTTRARFVMAGNQLFVMTTAGPDVDASSLDAAHQRLLQSFRPDL